MHSVAIMIVGMPGVGKTSLASMLQHRLPTRRPDCPPSLLNLCISSLLCSKSSSETFLSKTLLTLCDDLQNRVRQHPDFLWMQKAKEQERKKDPSFEVRNVHDNNRSIDICILDGATSPNLLNSIRCAATFPPEKAAVTHQRMWILVYDESRPETLSSVFSDWKDSTALMQKTTQPRPTLLPLIIVGNAINCPPGTPNLDLIPKCFHPFIYRWCNCSIRSQPDQILNVIHDAVDECRRCVRTAAPVRLTDAHYRPDQRACGTCSILGNSSRPLTAGGFLSNPASTVTIGQSCTFSVPLESTASQYLQKLLEIESDHSLSNPKVLSEHFESYRKFMYRKLRSKEEEEVLAPSLGVHAVWLAHLIRPQRYRKFCDSVLGSSAAFDDSSLSRIANWDPRTSSETSVGDIRLPFDEKKTIDIGITIDDVLEDRKWLWLLRAVVHDTERFSSPLTLESYVKEYEKHLYLLCTYPSLRAGPKPTVDLMWHSHMLHPISYQKDCLRLLGFELNHEPWPVEPDEDVELRRTLWQQEFDCDE